MQPKYFLCTLISHELMQFQVRSHILQRARFILVPILPKFVMWLMLVSSTLCHSCVPFRFCSYLALFRRLRWQWIFRLLPWAALSICASHSCLLRMRGESTCLVRDLPLRLYCIAVLCFSGAATDPFYVYSMALVSRISWIIHCLKIRLRFGYRVAEPRLLLVLLPE